MRKIIVILFTLALVGCVGSLKAQKEAVKPSDYKEAREKALATLEPVAQKEAVVQQISAAVGEVSEPVQKAEASEFETFVIYKDKGSRENHFIPSGWMGDYSDIKLNDGYAENPHSGKTCLKIEYLTLASKGSRWAGIYWQYPQNNWGNVDRSYNLTGAGKLTFWAKGEKGNEHIQEFKVGGISGEYPDSNSSSIGPVTLTIEWQQYEIDLSGKDLSHVIGGFAWATNLDGNPEGAVFYIDDIQFE